MSSFGETFSSTRRQLLQKSGKVISTGLSMGSIGSTIIWWFQNPDAAIAAAPITAQEADSFLAKSQRLVRPKPPKALRPKLDQDFAVLLMRSSYNALDELDCVAMVRNKVQTAP